ncbi:hypothetical protein FRC18_006219 [Serendipita sp. 400]|nr:hypothetical protein FRC18_006219 [Serendipita sp. 400]
MYVAPRYTKDDVGDGITLNENCNYNCNEYTLRLPCSLCPPFFPMFLHPRSLTLLWFSSLSLSALRFSSLVYSLSISSHPTSFSLCFPRFLSRILPRQIDGQQRQRQHSL